MIPYHVLFLTRIHTILYCMEARARSPLPPCTRPCSAAHQKYTTLWYTNDAAHAVRPQRCIERVRLQAALSARQLLALYAFLTSVVPVPQMKNPVLMGIRFKRTYSKTEGHHLCWLRGTSRSIAHELSDVCLTAVPYPSLP